MADDLQNAALARAVELGVEATDDLRQIGVGQGSLHGDLDHGGAGLGAVADHRGGPHVRVRRAAYS